VKLSVPLQVGFYTRSETGKQGDLQKFTYPMGRAIVTYVLAKNRRLVTEAGATVRLLVQVRQNLPAGADGKLARGAADKNWRIENRERQVLIGGGHLQDEVYETLACPNTSPPAGDVPAGTIQILKSAAFRGR
jgi:hypothetical protein